MRAIVGDGVEFVELILAQTLGAETSHTKTEAGNRQNDERGEDEGLAVRQNTTSSEELRSQTRSDDGVSVRRQDLILSTKRESVAEE